MGLQVSRIWCVGFYELGCRALGFRVEGFRFEDLGVLGVRLRVLGFRVEGWRVSGSIGIWDLGLRG